MMKHAHRAFMTSIVATIATIVAGCGKTEQPASLNQSIANVAETEPVSLKPNYDAEEDGVYLYQADKTEDEKKAGRASGTVVQFRFLGERDGNLMLVQQDASGNEVGRLSCQRDCKFMKASSGSEMTRLPFGDTSIAANAMADALNGFMKESNKNSEEIAVPTPVRNIAFSGEERELIDRATKLSGRCRDSEGATNPQVCDETDVVVEQLKRLHICYGPYSAIGADKKWMRCTPEDDAANG